MLARKFLDASTSGFLLVAGILLFMYVRSVTLIYFLDFHRPSSFQLLLSLDSVRC